MNLYFGLGTKVISSPYLKDMKEINKNSVKATFCLLWLLIYFHCWGKTHHLRHTYATTELHLQVTGMHFILNAQQKIHRLQRELKKLRLPDTEFSSKILKEHKNTNHKITIACCFKQTKNYICIWVHIHLSDLYAP